MSVACFLTCYNITAGEKKPEMGVACCSLVMMCGCSLNYLKLMCVDQRCIRFI